MKTAVAGFMCVALAACVAAGANVSFTVKPMATKDGETVKIAFAVSGPTDVEVAILDKDGKVVRHLAAGVLGGKNPPPAPLAPGLAQTLAWDGKDDFGTPAEGAPFAVRVRAGTGARFGRFIGDDPYRFGDADAIVADEDGNLYVSGFGGPANECQKTVRVFGPDGRFLRTLLPFPADLPPGAMRDVARWDESAKTWRPRNLNMLNPEFYSSNNGYADYSLVSASKTNGVSLARKNGLLRLDARGAVAGNSLVVPGQVPWPSDKEWPKADEIANALGYHGGPVIYTGSPDGKYLYLSGPYPNKDRATDKVPLGSVWRMRLDGSDPKMQPFVVIPATPDGPWSKDGGKNYGATGPVHGLAIDRKGNVYVTDREKGRVVAFSEDGTELGALAVPNPDLVAVHPTTGAIYVVRRVCNGWNTHAMAVEKYASLTANAPAASYSAFHPSNWPKFALSVNGDTTRLWFVSVAPAEAKLARHEVPKGFLVLEDKGAEFAAVTPAFGPKPGAQEHYARIAVDPKRDEVYVSDGVNLIWRYPGRSGDGRLLTKGGKPFYAPDLTVGYDGHLYVRSGEAYSGPLERVTRDLEPVPFSAIGTNVLYPIYGRYGIGYCEKGVGVGPDGTVYDCWMYDFAKYFVSGWRPDGTPLPGAYMAERLKQSKPVVLDVKLPDERKITSAIIGPVPADDGAIRVDLQGNIYLGVRLLPKDWTPPPAFEKVIDYRSFTGSVVKFGPEGGCVLGIADAESKRPDAPRIATHNEKTVIEGALRMYPGVAPFSGAGYGGNTSCCVCRVSRFDLDRYGRLALPNVVSTSVTLVDNAGNTILEFGAYGNFDSLYVPADAKDGKPIVATPAIPLAWPTGAGFGEDAVYVCDTYNRRVVRVDLTYQASETVEVK